ncbi:hypothetical protein ABLU29_09780 [Lactococcus lactis]|uniref:hypothetical protein n=1 Tax=Lactococcus lactis TaxID=1358 RepID=UPI0038778F99
MDEIIKRITAYAGDQEVLDKKVDEGLKVLQEAMPAAKFLFNFTQDETAQEFVAVVKSAYASGLANGYKDAVIEEMEKQNAK